MAELYGLLLPTRFDVLWLKALDTATLERLRRLLIAPGEAAHNGANPAAAGFWQTALMDALIFCVSQVSATGFASEIRVRMSPEAQEQKPFHQLPSDLESLRREVRVHGAQSPEALAAACRQWTTNLQILDRQLESTGAYVSGQDFSLADIAIGLSVNRWFETPLEHPDFAAVRAYYERLTDRKGFVAHGRNGTP